jgi:hypothetical protein
VRFSDAIIRVRSGALVLCTHFLLIKQTSGGFCADELIGKEMQTIASAAAILRRGLKLMAQPYFPGISRRFELLIVMYTLVLITTVMLHFIAYRLQME